MCVSVFWSFYLPEYGVLWLAPWFGQAHISKASCTSESNLPDDVLQPSFTYFFLYLLSRGFTCLSKMGFTQALFVPACRPPLCLMCCYQCSINSRARHKNPTHVYHFKHSTQCFMRIPELVIKRLFNSSINLLGWEKWLFNSSINLLGWEGICVNFNFIPIYKYNCLFLARGVTRWLVSGMLWRHVGVFVDKIF